MRTHRSVAALAASITLASVSALPAAAVGQHSSASAAPALCSIFEGTIVGTPGRDHLVGTPGKDVIIGLGGGDVIDGRGGNDYICGNDGNDRIEGGGGDDVILDGRGRDLASGGGGADTMGDSQEPGGNDLYLGGPGGDGFNVYKGGNDIYRGGSGRDYFGVQEANGARLFGGRGQDLVSMTGYKAPESVDAGAGRDRIIINSDARTPGQTMTVDHRLGVLTFSESGIRMPLMGFERTALSFTLFDDAAPTPATITVRGTSGNDEIKILAEDRYFQTTGPVFAYGYGGDDVFLGSRYDDVIRGGSGTDTANGNSGDDTCVSIEHATFCETIEP